MNDTKQTDGEIIKLGSQLEPLIQDTEAAAQELRSLMEEQNKQRTRQNRLLGQIEMLTAQLGLPTPAPTAPAELLTFPDADLEELYTCSHPVVSRFPSLTPLEWIYASAAGILSVAIDVIFVGTPEVVKVYHGGENFDGSKLTAILRSIGSDPNSKTYALTQWLSDKCKVPYDLSAVKDVMYPNNHRLRSLSHDPLFGLFFAVADIILGTTTCIDNDGKLRILVGSRSMSLQQKLLAVFYYIGHLLSDVCTARGLPVPGFFLTQFFQGGGASDSIAKIAEKMYLDGYDLRHLASTAVPVAIKNLLIDAYLKLSAHEPAGPHRGIADTELAVQAAALKRTKMLFISDCVATGGNLGKILLPPSCGNLSSINLTQWIQFIKSSIAMTSAALRNMTPETAVAQREAIDRNWDMLLTE